MGGILDDWKPSVLQIILFALGGGLLYLGQDWGVPGATEIGIGLMGVLLVAVGIDIGLRRLAVFKAGGSADVVGAYRGALELLWGAILVCLGSLIIAVVAMTRLVPGGVGNFWRDVLLSTTGIGVMLSVVGLMLMLNGLIRALAGSGGVNPGQSRRLTGALDRLAGAATLGFGALLSVIGLALLVAPGFMTAIVRSLQDRLG